MPSKDNILDWVHEFQSLNDEEKVEFAAKVLDGHKLLEELVALIDEKYLVDEVMEPLCAQFLGSFRSGDKLRLFTLHFLPALIQTYLKAASKREAKHGSQLETLLVGMYNLSIVTAEGVPTVERIRIPSLGIPSVYHDPSRTPILSLNEFALNSTEPSAVEIGPYPSVTHINVQNRFLVLTKLLRVYQYHLSQMNRVSLQWLCRLCSVVCRSGFESFPDAGELVKRLFAHDKVPSEKLAYDEHAVAAAPRIILHSTFLSELVMGIYFAMFNDCAVVGVRALEDLHNRASYELYSDVLLLTNAIRNSLLENPSGQPADGPLGLHVTQTTSHVPSKGLVTNASLRIRKLPEDIPIVAAEEVAKAHRMSNKEKDRDSKEESSLRASMKEKIADLKHQFLEGVSAKGHSSPAATTNVLPASEINGTGGTDEIDLSQISLLSPSTAAGNVSPGKISDASHQKLSVDSRDSRGSSERLAASNSYPADLHMKKETTL